MTEVMMGPKQPSAALIPNMKKYVFRHCESLSLREAFPLPHQPTAQISWPFLLNPNTQLFEFRVPELPA